MIQNEIKHTTYIVEGRNKLTVDGVICVVGFDSNYMTLELNEGGLSIEGDGLKIESLDQGRREIIVVGKIDGVFYTKSKRKKSIWGEIFG